MKALRHWPWLLLLIPLAFGAARLRFDVEVLNLLPGDVPAVEGLKLYQRFANASELIITVQASNAENAEAAARIIADTLVKQTTLTSSVAWQPPWLEHPDQVGEFIAYLWLNQPPEIFGRLTNRLSPANLTNVLAGAREQLATSLSPGEVARLSYDPFGLLALPEAAALESPAFGQGQDQFASADGKYRIIFVEASEDLSSYRACISWLGKIKFWVQNCLSSQTTGNDVVVRFTGRPAFVAEIAGGMERDITMSVCSTVAIIGALFWWAHRRWRPLLWLLALLALVLGSTLALGGLLFGTLNVVSVGFAAILLGLGVDYGLVLYQESLCAPHLSARELRQILAPGIVWSAVTTAGAFLVLNFGGLPGLAQLGSLVAIGVTLAAVVMLKLFPLLRLPPPSLPPPDAAEYGRRFADRAAVVWTATLVGLLVLVAVLAGGFPRIERSADSLRPRRSSAYAAVEELKGRLGRSQEPYWLLIVGRDEKEVARRLEVIQPILERAATNREIAGFTLAAALWPRAEFQSANRAIAGRMASERELVRAAARTQGFAGNALELTEGLLDFWLRAAGTTKVLWPTNEMSRWILDKMTARTPTNLYFLGLIYPPTNGRPDSLEYARAPLSEPSWQAGLSTQLPRDNVWLAGWTMLGSALLEVVERDFWRVMLPMIALLLGSLWLAFRRLTEVLLSLFTLAFALACLLALMKLAGWSWNLLNLMALPLLLGAGVDYSIHTQLALRRLGGDLAATRRGVGRALFLCAATTVAGFGSNIGSSNGGLASLGQVCASGIAFAYLTSAFFLPVWWKTLVGGRRFAAEVAQSGSLVASRAMEHEPRTGHRAPLQQPSFLYRVEFWRLGLAATRIFPPRTCLHLGNLLASLYWTLARERREVVIENVLTVLAGDRLAAEKLSRELFRNFAAKVVDLWRYESGQSIDSLFGELSGWEHFLEARETGRGVLLLTPHLGNWEFGAPLLAQRGVALLVITLAEPQGQLTEMRRAARARWGIETLVIGRDPFAFVEIIRRLEAGAVVALLMDRPPEAGAALVELFGRKFRASIAAAELARASGCALLPVYLPRTERGYAARILPEIRYDRPALRSRESRHKLTQEIMRAFEPAIRQHPDQWYHFVSIWH